MDVWVSILLLAVFIAWNNIWRKLITTKPLHRVSKIWSQWDHGTWPQLLISAYPFSASIWYPSKIPIIIVRPIFKLAKNSWCNNFLYNNDVQDDCIWTDVGHWKFNRIQFNPNKSNRMESSRIKTTLHK